MTSSPRDAIATTPGAFFCSTASRSTKSIEFPGFVPLPAASVRITIPASAAAASKPRRTAPRTAFILFIPALSVTFSCSRMTIIKASASYIRLGQSLNNCSNLIEYLLHALQLTALDCVPQGLIPNEGEFRLAVSKILKGDHVVRVFYGLMFYSNLRRINLVPLRVGKVHGGNDLLVQNNLEVFTAIPEFLAVRHSSANEKFPSHAKIHLAKRRSTAIGAPPLHYIFRVCPRLPNQFAWGIKNPGNNHPLRLIHRFYWHL